MYLLKPYSATRTERQKQHSHSTMYLLKPISPRSTAEYAFYSHSTMYLLKPSPPPLLMRTIIPFTFHHVSIKTESPTPQVDLPLQFTFHHVSIKTILLRTVSRNISYSHSTMYLLKLARRMPVVEEQINSHSTMYLLKQSDVTTHHKTGISFTFHHVSIKTVVYQTIYI